MPPTGIYNTTKFTAILIPIRSRWLNSRTFKHFRLLIRPENVPATKAISVITHNTDYTD